MPTKTFWQSKTNWFNVLTSAVSILTIATSTLPSDTTTVLWMTFVVGIINVALRTFFTSTPIA